MRLDRTRITIVERRQPELLDLTFLVIREFFFPIVQTFALLAIPLAFLNHWLIEWMAADLVEDATTWRYIAWLGVLVYVEAPLAGIFTTAYLGKATFLEKPSVQELLWEVVSMFHRIAWTQLVLRGVGPVICLIYVIDRSHPAPTPVEGILFLVLLIIMLVRFLRPYINEIVLLEKNPLWVTAKDSQITVAKRSSRLHGPNSGDLFGRGLSMMPVSIILALAFFGALWFLVATFTNDWAWGKVIVHVAIPASFWMLAAYVTVFRFLSYLDLRIRREGWEVELKMRAEANRVNPRTQFGGA